jgi:hypothetical protein
LVEIVYWPAVQIVIVADGRRQLAWFAVIRHPAEWLAQQIIEAFPWKTAPTYLVRDNDGAYGPVFRRRVQRWGSPHGAIVSAVNIFLATRSGSPPSIVEEGSQNPRPARVL